MYMKQRCAQRGQAMVLGMLLAGVAALMLVRYFAVGQVVGAKAKQLHALDATAYSAALIQARALNMLAYINRAQAGNQVAMAHLVTLGSWAHLGGKQSQQLASGNPPGHLIAMFFGPQHGAAYTAAATAAGLHNLALVQGELAQAYAGHHRAAHDILGSVQHDIVKGLPQVRSTAMQTVLRQNYPGPGSDSPFNLSIDEDGWPGYIRLYSGNDGLRSLLEKIIPLYGFLSKRDHTAVNTWAVDPRCPHLRHQLRRRGATELDASGRWQSADTQSFHALRSNKWIGCYYREYAMGWGWIPSAASQAMGQPHTDNPPDDFSAQDFWRWVKDATDWNIASGDANPLANSKASVERQRWQGGGLPAFYDTTPERAGSALRLSLTLRHPGPEGLTVTTKSSAETFFARPQPRRDSNTERANLFHPYWQARLALSGGSSAGAGEQQ